MTSSEKDSNNSPLSSGGSTEIGRLLSSCLDICRKQHRVVSIPIASIIWMDPKISHHFSPFLNPAQQRERFSALQSMRIGTKNYTEDIWKNRQLDIWLQSDSPSLIVLQGNSQSINRLERFSIEIIEYLEQQYPLAYILGNFVGLEEPGLLRQLAIQILQLVSLRDPVQFLVEIIARFDRASGSQEWFDILRYLCSFLSNLAIVVDFGTVGHSSEIQSRWAESFHRACEELHLEKGRMNLRVMLLGCRSFTLTSTAIPVIFVNQANVPPKVNGRQLSKNRLVLPRPNRPISTNPAPLIGTSKSIDMESLRTTHEVENEAVIVSEKQPHDLSVKESYPHLRTETPIRNNDKEANSAVEDDGGLNSELEQGQASSIVPVITEWEGKRASDSTSITMPQLPQARRDIKTAILCALTLEADAVEAIFDDHYATHRYGKAEGDPNTYSIGRIGHHRVVLVHMPGMGKSNAATVAANCRASFPEIRLAFVIGICGGVPLRNNTTEILLGDVIISEGIIQYDFGSQYPDGFKRKDSVFDSASKPAAEIRSLLSKLKGLRGGSRLQNRTLVHLRALQKELGTWAAYPGIVEDQLFESTYQHKHRVAPTCGCAEVNGGLSSACELARTSTCENLKCDPGKLVFRKRYVAASVPPTASCDKDPQPLIHFGLFASGDKVMKSAEDRDKIAKTEGIIAFEMEGAGVWDTFPCVIIKGICDYSDSHKNKKWRHYAAATAASCFKAFLEERAGQDNII